ncbi:MAG: hypothetical protein QNJ70_15395 [Xenococcaceae cyanobacterium MO_207.B15]|nr:hypothetical protein [Xenococcaceae cyanobacterium MO_207.B15]
MMASTWLLDITQIFWDIDDLFLHPVVKIMAETKATMPTYAKSF